MLAIEEMTTETIIHQKTVEHRITKINHDFVKPPHYYWINCINCFQNIADAKRKNLNFYITSCGCLYCMECLHLDAGLRKCFVHDKVTKVKSLSLNGNSAEITLENPVVGEKLNNIFRNNITIMLEMEKAIEFANKSYDVSVERLDQLLSEGECEKERLLAKLTLLEKDKQKLDSDIANLQRDRRMYEKSRYGPEIQNTQEDKFDSSYGCFKLPINYGVNNNFNTGIENIPNSYNSNECRDRPNAIQLCQKVRESDDIKAIKHYWDTVTGQDNPDNTTNNRVLKKSEQTVGCVPSTDNFRDFQNIRNPVNKLRYNKGKRDHKSDGRGNGRNAVALKNKMAVSNKCMMKPVSKSENYQDLLSQNARCLPTTAKNLQNRCNTKDVNIPNKNGGNDIVNRKASFRNQIPTKKVSFSQTVQPSSSYTNNFLTTTSNNFQSQHKYDSIPTKNYETDKNNRGGILKTQMPPKDFTFSPNLKLSNSKGKSCNTPNVVEVKSGPKLKERVSERREKLDSLNETKRKTTINDASCIGSVTDLIYRIRSEIDKIKPPEVACQNEYAAETLEGGTKNPGNFETIWISENIDEAEDLSNSFDSDIFNLRA